MLNVCPVVHVWSNSQSVPSRVVPVCADGRVGLALHDETHEHLEQAEYLGKALDRLGIVDPFGLDRDALVVWERTCNLPIEDGEFLVHAIGFARTSLMFEGELRDTFQYAQLFIKRKGGRETKGRS